MKSGREYMLNTTFLPVHSQPETCVKACVNSVEVPVMSGVVNYTIHNFSRFFGSLSDLYNQVVSAKQQSENNLLHTLNSPYNNNILSI